MKVDKNKCGLSRQHSHPIHTAMLLCVNGKKRRRKLKGAALRKARKGL